ncbi:MAG: threonylcarbamoyl-AMP synthase [Cytophagales bacterium]|nr:MAG: threonylcarbamoyl-AMP synthase [Cytophagales bacterium]
MTLFNTSVSVDIDKAIEWLTKGECVAIPTETVYGLAANAYHPEAIAKIFEIKQRPKFDPLIVHTDSIDKLHSIVTDIPERAMRLANKFWPGPLTLLLPKSDRISDLITSGLETVAVRIPNHPMTLALLSKLDFPIAAPSANPFGYISPTSPNHVLKQLKGKIPMILNGGNCMVGIESTIIGFQDDEPVIYRLGGLPLEAIEQCVGKLKVMPFSSSQPKSPGMLASHYAPRKKLYFHDLSSCLNNFLPLEVGVIAFDKFNPSFPEENQILLSPEGNLLEAAAQLFSSMRNLDESKLKAIYAESFPQYSLGLAINDRLSRASVREQ